MATACTCTEITTDPGCPQHGNKEARETPQVHIVTYEWRNWSRDIFAFATLEQAEQSVIHTAQGTVTDTEAEDIIDVESARNALTHHEHVVWIDSLDIAP